MVPNVVKPDDAFFDGETSLWDLSIEYLMLISCALAEGVRFYPQSSPWESYGLGSPGQRLTSSVSLQALVPWCIFHHLERCFRGLKAGDSGMEVATSEPVRFCPVK